MSDEPYIPFYKPYGMTDEEYQHEVQQAQKRHAEWEADQESEPATDKAYEEWVAKVADECTCCPKCWEVPCGGCLSGSICDDMCTCDEEETGLGDWDEDEELEMELSC